MIFIRDGKGKVFLLIHRNSIIENSRSRKFNNKRSATKQYETKTRWLSKVKNHKCHETQFLFH